MTQHKNLQEMEAALEHIRAAGRVSGTVALIVRRPQSGQREVLESCTVTQEDGLVGDNWKPRGYRKASDGLANPDMQITLMNVRAIAAIAGNPDDWPLAGDQFFVDLNLGKEFLPAGSRLRIGSAVLEISAEPHLGCLKFAERFGKDAVQFVNSDSGKLMNLRGVNARVVEPGQVKTGDTVLNLHRAPRLAPKHQADGGQVPAARVFVRNFVDGVEGADQQ